MMSDENLGGRGVQRWPVVIVGVGPAGLIAAITLARLGVRCLVVDRRRSPSELPRATVLSLHTMELLRRWGLEERVLAGGHDVEWLMSISPTLREAGSGDRIEVGYPTKRQSELISPTRPANVPQDHFEAVLLDYLGGLPTVEVRLGTELVEIVQNPASCRIVLRDDVSGAATVHDARYVLGADGARSVVRQMLDITMSNSGSQYEALSVVLHGPLWSVVGEHRYGIYSVQDRTSFATFLPAGRPDRWVYSFGWHPTRERLADYPTARLTGMIRASAGVERLDIRIGRIGNFSFIGGIANRFRTGRVFLLGDAAHRVTPRGGTGLNTAVADGFDLGWKLGWVILGWADEALLDSYEAERRPVAEHNLRRSLDPAGSRRTAIDGVHVDLGPRIPHLWLPTEPTAEEHVSRRSTLDLLTGGLTMITAGGVAPPAAVPAGVSAPVTIRRVDVLTARALGAGPAGAVIVRPDGALLAA